MAEILIKNMEMPKDMSNPLHISIFSNGSVWITHEGKTEAKAQELPPHGRLGDLDALAENIKDVYCNDCKRFKVMCKACKYGDILYEIEDAPTVIEASKETEAR